MIVVTLAVLVTFVAAYVEALAEPSSADSGPNFLVSAVMVLILFIIASFTTLTVSTDESYLRLKFGYGIFTKKFAFNEITRVQAVKNPWYYGWGIRLWLWPKMWIYNVSGFDAIEIVMKNGEVYRIGTDVPLELESVIRRTMES